MYSTFQPTNFAKVFEFCSGIYKAVCFALVISNFTVIYNKSYVLRLEMDIFGKSIFVAQQSWLKVCNQPIQEVFPKLILTLLVLKEAKFCHLYQACCASKLFQPIDHL